MIYFWGKGEVSKVLKYSVLFRNFLPFLNTTVDLIHMKMASTCTYVESLCCLPETITPLLTGYSPKQDKNLKNKYWNG